MDPLVVGTDVHISYGGFNAVRNANFTVRRGEKFILIGPSGCGKSTFLRILNRMHEVVPSAQLAGCERVGQQQIH